MEVSVALCVLWVFRVLKSLNLQISKTLLSSIQVFRAYLYAKKALLSTGG